MSEFKVHFKIDSQTIANSAKEIESIYVSNGWGAAYSEKLIIAMFSNGDYFTVSQNNRTVGFLRFFTDNVAVTHLSELVIHKNHQGCGLGKALLSVFLERYAHTAIYLEALPDSLEFFRKSELKEKPQLKVFSLRARKNSDA